MKIRYNILAILTVLLISCSEEKIIPDTGNREDGSVTVYFKAGGEITTRSTDLISSDNRQHAKYVHLYVFDSKGDCVQSRDVDWNQAVGTTADQFYTLKGLDPEMKYTLLAVGLDEDLPTSGTTTYGFPEAVTENTTKLTGLMATLADGKKQKDIATGELFSGWESVTAGETAGVTINLYRRVAGVLAYIKDIPTDVATIQIKLYKNQYKNVPLQKADRGNKYDITDHGDKELENSQVLMNIPVNETALNNTNLNDGHGYEVSKQAGTVLQGAYVLPIEAPTNATTYTLTLETYSADNTQPLKIYNVKMLTKTEHGGVTEDCVTTNYPLYANHIYSIGKRNVTDGTDEPISLGEDDIVITVNPDWKGSETIPLE